MTIEEKRARDSSRYHANKTPESMEKARIYSKLRYHHLRDADPEEVKRRRHAKYLKGIQPRLLHDLEYRAKLQEKYRIYNAQYRNDERYRMRQLLTLWLHKHAWVREELPWKSHRPVLYDKRIEHYCAGCEWTKHRGRQLYWQNMVSRQEFRWIRANSR